MLITTPTKDANSLNSATTNINVAAATAPTSGQVLTATSTTNATWQTPAAGSSTNWPIVKQSIGVGETCTITAGFQLIVAKSFVNSGTLVNNGELYII